MAVAKRQGRENPMKIKQRKVRGLEWGPQVEQRALLASSIYKGRPRGRKKHIKRGAKGLWVSLLRTRALSLSLLFASFGSACPHTSRMYFPFIF